MNLKNENLKFQLCYLLILLSSCLILTAKGIDDNEYRFRYKVSAVAEGKMIARAPNSGNEEDDNDVYDTGSFPCVVKVPAFTKDKVKKKIGEAASSAKNIYLLYFSKHRSNVIYVKWSTNPKGPWNWMVDPISKSEGDTSEFKESNSAMFLKNHEYTSNKDGNIVKFDHIGMPDVHYARKGKRFILIFHGEVEYPLPSKANSVQRIHKNFIASSDDMLNFNNGILENLYDDGKYYPLVISEGYTRAFQHNGKFYGIAKFGEIFDIPTSVNFRTGLIGKNYNRTSSASIEYDWDLSKEVALTSSSGEEKELYRNSILSTFAKEEYGIEDNSWVNHPFAVSRGDYVEIIFWVKKEKQFRDLYSVYVDPENQWNMVKGSWKKFVTRKQMRNKYGVTSIDHIGDAYLYDNIVYFSYRKKNSPRASAEGQIGLFKFSRREIKEKK